MKRVALRNAVTSIIEKSGASRRRGPLALVQAMIDGAAKEDRKVRALFSGGRETERELHRTFHAHRLVGEWFSEKAVPLMCDVVRKDQRFLWGTPWTEEVYSPPSPTLAEVTAVMHGIMLGPKVLDGLRKVLENPRHKAYRDVMRVVGKHVRVQLPDGSPAQT